MAIYGRSAGAISTCNHMAMPGSWPHFDAAIMQSGHCEGKPLEIALFVGAEFARQANCLNDTDSDDTADHDAAENDWFKEVKEDAETLGTAGQPDGISECLMGLSTQEVMNAQKRLGEVLPFEAFRWFPTIDYVELTDMPWKLFQTGNYSRKPWIAGQNEDEGSLWALNKGIDSQEKFFDKVKTYLDGMKAFYPAFGLDKDIASKFATFYEA